VAVVSNPASPVESLQVRVFAYSSHYVEKNRVIYKAEVHDISQRRHAEEDPRSQLAAALRINLATFGRVIPGYASGQTGRQTSSSQYSSPLSGGVPFTTVVYLVFSGSLNTPR